MADFWLGDFVQIEGGQRGRIAGHYGTDTVVRLADAQRLVVPPQSLRFDGDPPLHPDTDRPTVIAKHPNMHWPRQPKLSDYEIEVRQDGWRIYADGHNCAIGGNHDHEDWWLPTMLPAHRAWLQQFVTRHNELPGKYRLSDEDIESATGIGVQ